MKSGTKYHFILPALTIILLSAAASGSGCGKQAENSEPEAQPEAAKTEVDTTGTQPEAQNTQAEAPKAQAEVQNTQAEAPKTEEQATAANTDVHQNIDTPKSYDTIAFRVQYLWLERMMIILEHLNLDAAGENSSEHSDDEITEEDLAKLTIKYCANGNCPCGDGFCSEKSYCIIDLCYCGAHPEKGYFDYNTIASNNYGEFKCVSYTFEEGCGKEIYHDFLCTKEKGCKTGDDEKYAKSVNPFGDEEEDPYHIYQNNEELHIGTSDGNEKEDFYKELVAEKYYIEKCGKKLPEELKMLERDGGGSYSYRDAPTESECDLRRACNDSGVTPEHISEYVCDIGKLYYYECGKTYRNLPLGLRCNRPEGCTCGDTHCPNHALCTKGMCKYDLYYQHRVCPGEGWDPGLDDVENYISSLDGHVDCECINNAREFGDDEEDCYDECYWEMYPDAADKDPCSQDNNIPSEFSDRKPFKFTITTNIDTDAEYIKYNIYIGTEDGEYSAKYDVDCNGDGKYEYTGLTKDNTFCVYSPNSGKHQILLRGNIPSINLCAGENYSEALLSVDDWGDIQWKSMSMFASECSVLNKIPKEAPNLSEVTDMSAMFDKASSFNQPLEHWDVSHVTNMNSMFSEASSFNQPLEKWNVSNVESMGYMFLRAKSFNQPLEKWDVSNVGFMEYMFAEATSFDQPLDKWKVNNTNTKNMFKNASNFSHYPESWTVSSEEVLKTMFEGTKAEELARQKPLKIQKAKD